MMQEDIDRGQEFRKCIECFLCQNVCHVIRDHEENKPEFFGPRFFVRLAELDMHPLDTVDRRELIRARAASASATSRSAAPRCARAHQDHGQRHHPAEGTRGRRPLRPVLWVLRKLGGK
jgi:succinate dehydrogenase / fumarate reductase iron-sulfur subunit